MSKRKEEWLLGHHAVNAALSANVREIFEIWVTAKQADRYIGAAKQSGARLKTCSKDELDSRFKNRPHQGVAAKVGALPHVSLEDVMATSSTLLMLDKITDPHNLGACLRSADAFGAGAVLTPHFDTAPASDVVAKAASGALETVPLVDVGNLNKAIQKLKENNFWIIGLSGDADQSLKDINMPEKVVIVMGSEGEGLRDLVQKNCDFLAKIPMVGSVESLNVSVSTGIALYEVNRQK